MTWTTTSGSPVLVLGGTGTIGRRVVAQLRNQGADARSASRSTEPPLDWADPTSWDGPLAGVEMPVPVPQVTAVDDGARGCARLPLLDLPSASGARTPPQSG